MKKSFFQKGVWFWVGPVFIYYFFAAVGLVGVILSIPGKMGYLGIIICGSWSGVLIFFSIPLTCYHITFYEDRIYTKGELYYVDTQYEEQVFYKDIVSVRLLEVNLNSKKESVRGMSLLSGRIYFEFKLSNGETKWFFILYFSKKQRAQMLEIISEKTGLNVSYDNIERYDASLFGEEMRKHAREEREAKKAQNKDKKTEQDEEN